VNLLTGANAALAGSFPPARKKIRDDLLDGAFSLRMSLLDDRAREPRIKRVEVRKGPGCREPM